MQHTYRLVGLSLTFWLALSTLSFGSVANVGICAIGQNSRIAHVDTFSLPMTIRLSATASTSSYDLCQIGIANNATFGYDGFYDAYKLMGGIIDMWMSPSPNLNMTVNYMPPPTSSTQAIPLNFRSIYTGVHQFEFTGDGNLLPFNAKFTLFDNYTNTTYTIGTQNIIQFSVIAGVAASFTNRFVLNYIPVVGLPSAASPVVQIYPNPVAAGSTFVLKGLVSKDDQMLSLMDTRGRVVLKLPIPNGADHLPISLPQGISAGLYWILTSGTNQRIRLVVR